VDTKSFGVSQLAPLAAPAPRSSRGAGQRKQQKPSTEAASAAASQVPVDDESVDPAAPEEAHTGKRARHNQTERQRVDRLNRLFQKVSVTLDDPEADDLDAIGRVAEEKALTLAAAPKSDGSKTEALGGRSKAEVLEGALLTITQLRRMLKEERLARSLDSITMSGTETLLDGMGIDAAAIDEATAAMDLGEEDFGETDPDQPEPLDENDATPSGSADQYVNVTWNAEDAAFADEDAAFADEDAAFAELVAAD